MLYLTAQRRKNNDTNSVYMSNRHMWGLLTPMLSTAKLKPSDLNAAKDTAVDVYEIKRENILVRTSVQSDMEEAYALSTDRIFPIIAINVAENNVSIVANVRDDLHSDMHRNVGDSETVTLSSHKAIEYIKCNLDPKVFPNGVKDLLAMFDL